MRAADPLTHQSATAVIGHGWLRACQSANCREHPSPKLFRGAPASGRSLRTARHTESSDHGGGDSCDR